MFRGVLFYGSAILIAALLVAASLGPRVFAPSPALPAGVAQGEWLAFDSAALAALTVGPELVRHTVFDDLAVTGVRIAVKPGGGDPLMHQTGARLPLAEPARAALGPGPWIAEVDVRPLGVTQAETLRLGAAGPLIVEWAEPQLLAAEPQTLVYTLPATSDGALEAVTFWPASSRQDYNFGVELHALRLKRAP